MLLTLPLELTYALWSGIGLITAGEGGRFSSNSGRKVQDRVVAFTHPEQHLGILLRIALDAGQQIPQPLLPSGAIQLGFEAALQHLQHDCYRRTGPRRCPQQRRQ